MQAVLGEAELTLQRLARFHATPDWPYLSDQEPQASNAIPNTNGPLRQYFLKSTDLSVHTREHLNTVAAEPNSGPRKTLGRKTPAERLPTLLKTHYSRSSAFRRHTAEPRQGER